ncbi:MAG: hypothetical protein R3A10_12275 [Caldilineaceae bacterium]
MPHTLTIVGIDENTALRSSRRRANVGCRDRAAWTVIRDGDAATSRRDHLRRDFELGPFHLPDAAAGLPAEVWADTRRRRGGVGSAPHSPRRRMRSPLWPRRCWRARHATGPRPTVCGDESSRLPDGPQDTPDGSVLEPTPGSPQHKAG